MGDPYHENFIGLVQKMRQHQKQYFASRNPADLSESKRLEKQVDQFIDLHNRPDLFVNQQEKLS